MKPLVFLDIDGTLLFDTPNGQDDVLDRQRPGAGLEALLEFLITYCEPYWLSYRCRKGNLNAMKSDFFPHVPKISQAIEVAYWDTQKHEALPLDRAFLWFDDLLEEPDKLYLTNNNLLQYFHMVERDHAENPKIILAQLQQSINDGFFHKHP